MTDSALSAMTLLRLRALAREKGVRLPSNASKSQVVALLQKASRQETAESLAPAGLNPAVPELLQTGECGHARGELEIQPAGYGFLRALDEGQKDVYLSINQIRRFHLADGDRVEGVTRPLREGERYMAMLIIQSVNGLSPAQHTARKTFDELTPLYPKEQLILEPAGDHPDPALRLIDLMAPLGRGQRGLIVSPPKAGKTTLLKKIALSLAARYPEMDIYMLLLDERPEEVTDMQRTVPGQVFFSTFDDPPQRHAQVAEQVLSRARRQVECGRHVVLLVDSLTRLARANNLNIAPSGRLLSGGLDPAALALPKRLFGSARQLEEGGSLTVLATALIDTGSRLDEVVYEEFKGTGNMELHLDRRLQEKRIFPALNLYRSGTRREEDLLSPQALSVSTRLRRLLDPNPDGATEMLLDLVGKTANNAEFLAKFDHWMEKITP